MAKKGCTPWNKGKTNVYSEETLSNMSLYRKLHPIIAKGQKLPPRSEEHSRNISLSKKGSIPWNKGLIIKPGRRIEIWFSKLDQRISNKQEGLIKISKKLKGKKHSSTHVNNQVSSRKKNGNYKMLEPQKKLISIGNTGRKHNRSDEYKQNLSIAVQAFWDSNESQELRNLLSKQRKGVPRPPHVQEILKKNRESQIFPTEDNMPETMMQIALALNGIKFEKQKLFKFSNTSHRVDIFIEPNICVEVDGDHWHANPNTYHSESIIIGKRKAKDVWARDILINHELNLRGYQVIRIWVSDIEKNTQGCAEKIIHMIKDSKENKIF